MSDTKTEVAAKAQNAQTPIRRPGEIAGAPLSFAAATAYAGTMPIGNTGLTRKAVADFLAERFDGQIATDRRANDRAGNLSRPDRYYAVAGGKHLFFLSVYEVADDRLFFLIACDGDTAAAIAARGVTIRKSAFPASSYSRFYLVFADANCGADEIFGILETVYTHIGAGDCGFRTITVKAAHERFSDEEILAVVREDSAKAVARKKTENDVIASVYVDTLSHSFSDGAYIDRDVLLKAHLVPEDTSRVEILARGVLTKKFKVVADGYEPDAAKMIVALGGKLICPQGE